MLTLQIGLVLIAAPALGRLCKQADQWIIRHITVSRRLKAVAELRMFNRVEWG
jgi:hypothetical protein